MDDSKRLKTGDANHLTDNTNDHARVPPNFNNDGGGKIAV